MGYIRETFFDAGLSGHVPRRAGRLPNYESATSLHFFHPVCRLYQVSRGEAIVSVNTFVHAEMQIRVGLLHTGMIRCRIEVLIGP